MTPIRILGISAFYHDSAAALVVDGKIVAAAHEERFSRKKHDDRFPKYAIEYVLKEGGITSHDLSAVVFYDKPLLKFERLLEVYHNTAPQGLISFTLAMAVWIKEKLFIKHLIRKGLKELEGKKFPSDIPILFPEHHLSHAASAFYPSPFDEAAILTVDGVGEWATTTICHGRGKDIKILKEMRFPHSLGLLYSAFTYYCGFKINSGEYKLMGLAPYGIKGKRVEEYKKIILTSLVDLKDDGSLFLNMEYFTYLSTLRTVDDQKWEALFKIPPRSPESELSQKYMDLALAIQEVTEEAMKRLARTAYELTGSSNLVMAGGVALNCVANARIEEEKIFDSIWVQPAAGDAGGALGAALAGYYIWFDGKRIIDSLDSMQGAYLGPAYSEIETERAARKYGATYATFDSLEKLTEHVASLIAEGSVVGWVQGRMEWGPRALGNRSILGDTRDPEMQKKLNLKIKYREGFRPFAPAVLEEEVNEYFETTKPSPYMLFTAPVRAKRRKPLKTSGELLERLYSPRSDIPSVTHLDYSARLQTVSKTTNPRFHALIEAFKNKTGYGVLVNTSFNVRGEPIVCTPEDAYRCFMNTEMDYLVVGNILFDKKQQPAWEKQVFAGGGLD